MTPRQAFWHEVQSGTYVRDKAEKTWRVEDRRGDALLLQDRDGERVMVTPDGSTLVTVLEPTEGEALSTVQNLLGAEVVAVKTVDRITCPPLPHRLPAIHTHMQMLHAIWTASGPGSKSTTALLAAHREDHGDPSAMDTSDTSTTDDAPSPNRAQRRADQQWRDRRQRKGQRAYNAERLRAEWERARQAPPS